MDRCGTTDQIEFGQGGEFFFAHLDARLGQGAGGAEAIEIFDKVMNRMPAALPGRS
jgi:hypothetical protein